MGVRGLGLAALLILVLTPTTVADAVVGDGEPSHRQGPWLDRPQETSRGERHLETGLVIPAGSTIGPGDLTTRYPSGSTPVLSIEGPLRVLGTSEHPVRFEAPVEVTGGGSGDILVRHAVFAPVDGSEACALSINASAARVEASVFTGARAGLCVQPSHPDEGEHSLSRTSLGDPRELLLPFLEPDYVASDPRGLQDEPRSPSPGFELRGNRYVGNAHAGLHVTVKSEGPTEPPGLLVSRSETFASNGEGIRLEGSQGRFLFEDAHVERNGVGLAHRGGQVRLDHAVFDANTRWDVHSTGRPGDVQFSGSIFDTSCVHVEGREGSGCERGSVGVPLASLVFALVASFVFLVSEAGRYLLTRIGFGLGLYSRIPRDELLEHETRRALFEHVQRAPGRSIAEIARSLELARSTAVYHLFRLEREDLLRSRRQGIHRRFYPADIGVGGGPTSTREKVFSSIVEDPGIHAGDIARDLGMSRQLVSYHVRRLREGGRVQGARNQRVTHLYPSDKRADPKGTVTPGRGRRQGAQVSPVSEERGDG